MITLTKSHGDLASSEESIDDVEVGVVSAGLDRRKKWNQENVEFQLREYSSDGGESGFDGAKTFYF